MNSRAPGCLLKLAPHPVEDRSLIPHLLVGMTDRGMGKLKRKCQLLLRAYGLGRRALGLGFRL